MKVCKSSSSVWDPGALLWKRPSQSKTGSSSNSLLDSRLTPGLGLVLQRDTLFFTPAGAALKGADGDAESVCAPLVDIEHAWLQDRSVLHHSSSHRPFEPQRRPRSALFLRAFLDRRDVVCGEESPQIRPPPLPLPPCDRRLSNISFI